MKIAKGDQALAISYTMIEYDAPTSMPSSDRKSSKEFPSNFVAMIVADATSLCLANSVAIRA